MWIGIRCPVKKLEPDLIFLYKGLVMEKWR